ncbi:hypothetical protein HPB52_004640 [Rhipicephalus sanguineus]|uniref:C2H2-type domain-containing protein n=2 Tax=Rhipicephalus sanguineus TaxID=34632 RepID=A0A9D4QDB1_RHISA|nr:hypothetical protein HPB52_004640 [Rhipicephalus sanguineus]
MPAERRYMRTLETFPLKRQTCHRIQRAQTKTANGNNANSASNTLARWKSCFSTPVTHSQDLPFWCDNCGAAFTCQGELTEHESTHVDKNRFCCALCSKIFINSTVLRDHTAVHRRHPGYRCHLCPMV